MKTANELRDSMPVFVPDYVERQIERAASEGLRSTEFEELLSTQTLASLSLLGYQTHTWDTDTIVSW